MTKIMWNFCPLWRNFHNK